MARVFAGGRPGAPGAAWRPRWAGVGGTASGNERRAEVSSPNGTQAVDRAARLLTQVVHAPRPVTFTELVDATGLAKSTTSRLLLALERNGLVRRDEAGRFRPGAMFARFAWRGGAEAGLTEVAQPYLDRLGEATGETVNLGVAADGMVEQIAQVDAATCSARATGSAGLCRRTAPRWARCCSPSAPRSCRRAGSSGGPSRPSPAGLRWTRNSPLVRRARLRGHRR